MLDLSSDEETVGMAHSFCSDFQGMHLWESSSIQARVLRSGMSKVATSIPGRSVSSIMSAFWSAQIAAMWQELDPNLGPWDLACPRETPEGEGVNTMPRSLGPNY